MSAGLRTLPLRCYRGLKLHILFEPNAMRQKKKDGRSRPKLQAFVRLLGENQSKLSAEPLDFQLKSCLYPKPPRIQRPVPH